MMDAETIAIAMDEPTARALRHLLQQVGEHWTAGADLGRPPFWEMAQLNVVLRSVDSALGAERPAGWRDAPETRLSPEEPADPKTDLARAVTDLGRWLTKAGQRHRGLIALEAAVELYRQLAAAEPGAYTPHLADAVAALGIRMAEAGYDDEALTATEQALEIYRRLAADDPAYEPHLTRFLSTMSRRLSGLGRHPEALAAEEQAAEVRQRLAMRNPAS